MPYSNKIQISNIEIIFIDDDGFALGYILNKSRSNQEIEIPFVKTNIKKLLKRLNLKEIISLQK